MHGGSDAHTYRNQDRSMYRINAGNLHTAICIYNRKLIL
jgi:hypothetical protein